MALQELPWGYPPSPMGNPNDPKKYACRISRNVLSLRLTRNMLIRAFIAVDLPDKILAPIGQIIQSLQQDLPKNIIRWVPLHNIHLTLMFLGDVEASKLEPLKPILSDELSAHASFDIHVRGLGVFPSVKKPRVLWIGVVYPPEFAAIYHDIQQRVSELGYPRDERPLSPHLTIGRVQRTAKIDEINRIDQAVLANDIGSVGTATIDCVHLYRSDLKPNGAIYTQLHSVMLGN
jgi:RNA 2',3'-cyclic 3'-phosphodiesterase